MRGVTTRGVLFVAVAALLLTACAPTTTELVDLDAIACRTDPAPVVAVIEFENTTGRFGTTVTGVEEAATARLITLMKESDCYVVVERSVLQDIIAEQGLESTDPVELAKAAGAGYVVTGTVTRATVDAPSVNLAGVALGNTTAQVEVDVRSTDIITGEVVVSMTGRGDASSPDIAISRLPVGTIAYDNPAVGPLLADASEVAVNQVVAALLTQF